jgi:ribosomal protein S18 acetylase RimI-like enzyme
MASEVRGLSPAEAAQAAEALAAAFQDDPVMSWCFPRAGRRAATLRAGFELFLRHVWLAHDRCFTTDGVAGAACWLPPGQWRLPKRRQIALLPSLLRIGRERSLRFGRVFALVERKHPRPPHWYLATLGVAPADQGRGLGSRLMHPILARCDAEGMPAYLEASSPRNRALYERHGFEMTEELKLPGGGPPIWLMWREPAESAR